MIGAARTTPVAQRPRISDTELVGLAVAQVVRRDEKHDRVRSLRRAGRM